jgi:hypothetical protein
MINMMEKIIDWLDDYLPIIIVPLAILLLLRCLIQIITY